MKIARAEAISLQIPFQYGADSFRIGAGAWRHLDFALIRIETDDGIVGWGEAFSYTCRAATIAAFNTMVVPLALGHDASDIAGLHAKIQKQLHLFGRYGITVFALSGLDIALWDIAGKSAGKPIHMLLGGNTRASVECYASLLRYSAPALVRQYAGRAVEEGFAAIKLHEIEEPAIAAAREVVPDHRPLLLDVNCEWHPLEAVAAGKRFSKFNLGWFEEPVFPPEDFASIRAVREASGIPIAAGENFCFATQFAALFDANAVDYAQPSVTKVGGITELMKVMALSAAHGVRLAPHSPYFGPGALAPLQVLAVYSQPVMFEYFYLWADASLYRDLLTPRNGVLQIPSAPGLGADPDPDVIARYRVT